MFNSKELAWSRLKVGVVITLAILLLIVTVFFAGGLEDMLSPKVEIKAQIKDVMGLREGSPVWISGIEIGYVKSIYLHEECGTVVTMLIKKDVARYIKKDSTASVLTMGLLGDKYIELSTGSSNADSVRAGDVIKGVDQISIQDLVRAGSETLVKISEFIEELEGFIKKTEKITAAISRSKFLTEQKLYDNLEDASKNLAIVLKEFKESEGTIKKLVQDPGLYNKVLSATSSVEEFGRKMNEGTGTLKRLADDPALYENLNKASLQLNSVLEKLESGEGLAGSILKDKELSNELKGTISELKALSKEIGELTKDIKSNPKKYFKFSIF